MKRLADPHWALIALFLIILGTVPLIQILIEAGGEDGVRVFELFSQPPTAANLRSYERGLESVNWAARLTRPWIQFGQFQWLREGGPKAVIAPDGWYFFKPGLNYMLSRLEPVRGTGGTNDPFAAIVDFRDQLEARGIRLILVPVPNKESIYPDRVTPRAEALGVVIAPRSKDLLTRLRVAGVEMVDLFELFGQARRQTNSAPQPSLYLAQDTHWSPAGVDLAAKTVARRLLELNWIQQGSVHYQERAASVNRLGDILRMMRVPQVEQSVPPEKVPSIQVIWGAPARPYTDGAEAEILVLGDSFSRIYQLDEPTGAGFVARLAKELKQPLLMLVNDGGGSTLVRQELRGRPAFLKNKKVVVWEFVERDIGLGIEGWKLVPLPPPIASSSAAGDEKKVPGSGRPR